MNMNTNMPEKKLLPNIIDAELRYYDSLMPILDEQSRDLRTMKRFRCYHCGKPMSEEDLDEIEEFLDTLNDDMVKDAMDRLRIAKRNPNVNYFHACKFGY